ESERASRRRAALAKRQSRGSRMLASLRKGAENVSRRLAEQRAELASLARSRHGDGVGDLHYAAAQGAIALIEYPLVDWAVGAIPLSRVSHTVLVVGIGVGAVLTADMVGWTFAQNAVQPEGRGSRSRPQTLLLAAIAVAGGIALAMFVVEFNRMRAQVIAQDVAASTAVEAVVGRAANAVGEPLALGGIIAFQTMLLLVALHLTYTRKLGQRRRELARSIAQGERRQALLNHLVGWVEGRVRTLQHRAEDVKPECARRVAQQLGLLRVQLAAYEQTYLRRFPEAAEPLFNATATAWERLGAAEEPEEESQARLEEAAA
ncbi:MAG TPA: hypothetical protein VMS76_07105, partial [Planctomycetota bacterium]|nr:hypothetical protein [Planctomycetota bacterium]